MKTTMMQAGSSMARRPAPNRADFILNWVIKRGSFRGDGRAGADWRAAQRLVKMDIGLEIVADDSLVRDKTIEGWIIRRTTP